MSTLAVVATFAQSPPAAELADTVRRMLAAGPGYPDGIGVVAPAGAALGFGRLCVSARQGHGQVPLHDAQAGVTLVADVRLDNRDELAALLGRAGATDAELVLAGWHRFGPALPHRLVGDFAFVLWDAPARRLFAARDPFGVRPLVYRVEGDRVLVASDVKQILAVDPSARVIDDAHVIDLLLYRRTSADRTYFLPIKNVPPGHTLATAPPVGTRARRPVEIARWWRPPAPGPRFSSVAEGLAEFRRVFARAVADRLIADHPILIHLSGGLDSPVVALVAGTLGATVPLRAVGAVHPGLSCDESVYMKAAAARLPYPAEFWDATKPDLVDLDDPWLAGPGLRVPRSSGSAEDVTIARREGARVVLSGLGGDFLHPPWEVVRELVAEGRLAQLLRVTLLANGRSWPLRRQLARDAVRKLAPGRLRSFVRRWRAPDEAPAWLAEPYQHLARVPRPEPDEVLATLGPAAAARLHELTRPVAAELVGNGQRIFAAAGVELRCPFLDVRVAEVANRLPLEVWRPALYDQRLHAIAYADLLPPEIRARRRKTVFGAAVASRIRAAEPKVRHLLAETEPPRVARYLAVSPRALVESAYASAAEVAPAQLDGQNLVTKNAVETNCWELWSRVWNLAALEAWMRIV